MTHFTNTSGNSQHSVFYSTQELAAHLNRPHVLSIKPQPPTNLHSSPPSLPTHLLPLTSLPPPLLHPPNHNSLIPSRSSTTIDSSVGGIVSEEREEGDDCVGDDVEGCKNLKCKNNRYSVYTHFQYYDTHLRGWVSLQLQWYM